MRLPRVRDTVAVAMCLIAAGAFSYLAQSDGQDERQYVNDGALLIITWLSRALNLMGMLLFLRNRTLNAISDHKAFVALMSLCFISVIWSIEPLETATSLYRLLPFLLGAAWLAECETKIALQNRLLLLSRTVLYSGVVALVLFPDLAFMEGAHAGALRGAFNHKNNFAFHLVMALTVFLWRLMEKRSVMGVVEVALAATFLVMSHSATGLACLIALLAFFGVSFTIKSTVGWLRASVFLFLMVGAIVVGGLIITNLNEVLDYFGRDATFTGRDRLWSMAISGFYESPLTGHGFRAYWKSPKMGFGGVGTPYIQSHNGYLDALVDGGLIELGVLVTVLLSLIFRSILMLVKNPKISDAFFPLSVGFILTFHNLVETNFPFDVLMTPVFIFGALSWIKMCEKEAPSAPPSLQALGSTRQLTQQSYTPPR